MKKLAIAIICCCIGLISMFAIDMQDDKEKITIAVPDNIFIMIGDSSFYTHNDTVECLCSSENGLVEFMQNEYTIRGHKLKKNHPNYGYFQMLTEQYFNTQDGKYMRMPNGKIVSDKQNDIQEYGYPQKYEMKDDISKFTWKFKDGTTKTIVYNIYGKRLYVQ